ncbi:BA75_01468T0 [Komagataella pastoris]|uniref:BA75_01468T0 n=1 Tax=Komagataella pastoris TaxID=4922 RepID=A0A1B2J9D7_PICPA|nr:BA75_01468T0 [Komagataella pastoris]
MDNDVSTILTTLRLEADEESSPVFYTLEDLYERKLWYQLTTTLDEEFYQSNDIIHGLKLRLFDRFITKFWDKLNRLKLVEFLLLSLLDDQDLTDDEALEILSSWKAKIKDAFTKESRRSGTSEDEEGVSNLEYVQSLIYIDSEIAKLKLGFDDQKEDAKTMIDEISEKLENLNSVDNKINASYYNTLGEYYKINKDYNNFYYTSLLYLACVDEDFKKEKIPSSVQEAFCFDLAVSALLGDKIYNFGELIMHEHLFEVFNSHKNLKWLYGLVQTISEGDLKAFENLIEINKGYITEQCPLLLENINFLQQKICIMALIELVFSRPSNETMLPFSEIISNISLLTTDDEVEYLIMKCLSLKLIKGSIDQVNSQVNVTWIQPRIMSKSQISKLQQKLKDWNVKIGELTTILDNAGKEIWV